MLRKKQWTGIFGIAITVLLLSGCMGGPDNIVVTVPSPAETLVAATATAKPMPTKAPTKTPIPAPTSTPAPSLRRLTEPGCCTQPAWSFDSRQVIFLDKPSASAPAGLYAVDVTQPASVPTLFSDRVLTYSPDFSAAAYPDGEMALVERLDTGQRWKLDTGGNPPALSPDNSRLIWQDTADYGAYDARRTDVWLADLKDDELLRSELVLTVYGGSAVAWFPDNQRLLISARPSLTIEQRILSVFSLNDYSMIDHPMIDHPMIEIARADRMAGITLSPSGTWVAFFVSFSTNKDEDGIWIARTDGAARHKLDLFGSYQWRDDGRLLLIPMEPGQPSNVVCQVDAASGKIAYLTDPSITPFKIAGGDWRVSPDGGKMVFVNAQDKALWLLTFP